MHPLNMDSTTSLPTALLDHTVDGSSHHDWLLSPVQDPSPEDRCLVTYRMRRALNQLGPGQAEPLQRLPDHRGLYLDLSGPRQLDPVDGRDRGTVTPIDRGSAMTCSRGDGTTDIRIRWDRAGTEQIARIHHGDGGEDLLEILEQVKDADPESQGVD